MVATLVRLRLLLLRNTFRRHTAQLVLFIVGGLYGLGILAGVVVGLALLHLAPLPVVLAALSLGGGAVLLGWIVLPLVATGVDETLEPAKLAAHPIPLRQLMLGLFFGGVLGIPGIVTTIASLATSLTWIGRPGIAAIALVCGLVGAATCVVGSRAAAVIGAGLSSGRRFRELRWFIVFVPLILAGPITFAATQAVAHGSAAISVAASIASWTPFGAIWAIPASVALGDGGAALVRALIAVATLAVLVALWRAGLARALVSPASSTEQTKARGGLGWFGRFGRGPVWAVAARSLTYWQRDPRYQRQLILIPLLPVLLGFYGALNHTNGFPLALGPAAAFFLALAIVSDVSYDSTAFTLHVARGVPGRADRAARVIAVLVFALPVVVVFTVGSTIALGAVDRAPALLGLAFGVLGAALGTSSVSSALLVVPVPAPGDNPFRSRPGTNLITSLQMLAVWGIVAGVCLPEIALLIAASITGSAVLGWVLLAVGVVLGAVALVVGVVLGGRLLDRRAPELLLQLRRGR